MKKKLSPERESWHAMIQRCTNPNRGDWRYYGGRGINVCKRWRLFSNFLVDMGRRPNGKTLDRIHNDRDYKPSNCRWATYKQQRVNSRPMQRNPAPRRILAGKKFFRLLVIRFISIGKDRNAIWECRCNCGIVKNIAGASLTSGNTKSCGCLHREKSAKNLRAYMSKRISK